MIEPDDGHKPQVAVAEQEVYRVKREYSIDVGDPLPGFKLWDHLSRLQVLVNAVRGKSVVLLFYPKNGLPACQKVLRSYVKNFSQLDELAHIFAITNETVKDNATAAGLNGVPFPILADERRELARYCGVSHNLTGEADPLGTEAMTCLVADPNLRIVKIDRNFSSDEQVTELKVFLENQVAVAATEVAVGAPVLRVPRALSGEICRRLIQAHGSGQVVNTGTLRDGVDGGTLEHGDQSIKQRRDFFVRDGALREELTTLIGRRVVPEIFKAFHYRVTRFDDFKVGCYEADGGGHFQVHRDNSNVSGAHRRFAMSLNLNTGDYEGGHLRFPEFGPHLYRPALGEAVIFSCSLLHEALPVTAGRRYVLLSFLFGEAEQQMLARRLAGKA